MGNKKSTIKKAKASEFFVLRDNSGNITNIIFPNSVQFGINNSLSASVVFAVDALPDQDAVRSLGSETKQWKDLYVSEGTIFLGGARISLNGDGKVQFRDVGSSSDIVLSNVTVSNSSVLSALGFTPANVNFSNVTAGTARSALGISSHVTGSISDLFSNLTAGRVTTGLGFTPANVNFSNVTAGTGRSALGISDHVTGSISDLFNNLTADRVTTGLGFTPANINFSNVTAGTGRSALGISDHVTGSLADVFNNLTPSRVTSGLGFTPVNTDLSNAPSTILNSSVTKSSLGLGNVENKSSSTIRGEITSGDITSPLGYSPVDPSNPPSNLLNSNVTRGSLGISDHVTGSISDLFDNLTPTRVTNGLGFTPINTNLSNAPSTILNSSVSRSSLGISDFVTGSIQNAFTAGARARAAVTQGFLSAVPAFQTTADIDHTNIEVVAGHSGATTESDRIIVTKALGYFNAGSGQGGASYYYPNATSVKIDSNSDMTDLRNMNASGGIVVGSTSLSAVDGTIIIKQDTDTLTGGASGIRLVESDDNNDIWSIQRSSTQLHFRRATNGSTFNARAFISGESNVNQLDFTGQHRSIGDASLYSSDNIGKIVISSGRYNNLNENNLPSIDEALPIIQLAQKRNQKNVYGVISNFEISGSNTREYLQGNFSSVYERESADRRIIVNSVGEGAVWVTNMNGNLENGDYITTCEIPGHGMKQDDDILHNYTVAKITQDCNFQISGSDYQCEELIFSGSAYRRAFVGCTYHCG